jgi:hypothetical protein
MAKQLRIAGALASAALVTMLTLFMLSHVSFPLTGIGTLKCYHPTGEQRVC